MDGRGSDEVPTTRTSRVSFRLPDGDRFTTVFDLWIVGTGAVVAGDMLGWTPILVVGVGGACLVVLGMTWFFLTLGMSVAELAVHPKSGDGGTAAQLVEPYLGTFPGDICVLGESLKLVCGTAVCVASFSAYICDAVGLPEFAQFIGWVIVVVGTASLAYRGEASHQVQIGTTLFSLAYLVVFYISAAIAGTFGKQRLSELGGVMDMERNDDDMAGGFDYTMESAPTRLGLAITTSAWFLLGSEGIPLAAPMCVNPGKLIPKAIYLTVATTACTALLTILASAAVSSDFDLIDMNSHPLLIGFQNAWQNPLAGRIGSLGAVVGVAAGFNGFYYYTAQLCGEVLNSNYKISQHLAAGGLILASMFILLPLNNADPDQVLNVLVWVSLFGAAMTYIVQLLAYLEMRRNHPAKDDHWKSPLGSVGAVVGILLNLVFLVSLIITVVAISDYRSGGYVAAVIIACAALAGIALRRDAWLAAHDDRTKSSDLVEALIPPPPPPPPAAVVAASPSSAEIIATVDLPEEHP